MWLGIFSLAVLVQVSYGITLVIRFLTYIYMGDNQKVLSGLAPISIIIAAKNEAENLLKNIPTFLNLR